MDGRHGIFDQRPDAEREADRLNLEVRNDQDAAEVVEAHRIVVALERKVDDGTITPVEELFLDKLYDEWGY